jgi:hypothetical protein
MGRLGFCQSKFSSIHENAGLCQSKFFIFPWDRWTFVRVRFSWDRWTLSEQCFHPSMRPLFWNCNFFCFVQSWQKGEWNENRRIHTHRQCAVLTVALFLLLPPPAAIAALPRSSLGRRAPLACLLSSHIGPSFCSPSSTVKWTARGSQFGAQNLWKKDPGRDRIDLCVCERDSHTQRDRQTDKRKTKGRETCTHTCTERRECRGFRRSVQLKRWLRLSDHHITALLLHSFRAIIHSLSFLVTFL